MESSDEITKAAFIEFANNAVRSISLRNAGMPSTQVVEVLV
jgi:ATP-binding protein involved in chromosome partitioning